MAERHQGGHVINMAGHPVEYIERHGNDDEHQPPSGQSSSGGGNRASKKTGGRPSLPSYATVGQSVESMPRGELIVATIFAAFLIFITARGELAQYIRLLV